MFTLQRLRNRVKQLEARRLEAAVGAVDAGVFVGHVEDFAVVGQDVAVGVALGFFVVVQAVVLALLAGIGRRIHQARNEEQRRHHHDADEQQREAAITAEAAEHRHKRERQEKKPAAATDARAATATRPPDKHHSTRRLHYRVREV